MGVINFSSAEQEIRNFGDILTITLSGGERMAVNLSHICMIKSSCELIDGEYHITNIFVQKTGEDISVSLSSNDDACFGEVNEIFAGMTLGWIKNTGPGSDKLDSIRVYINPELLISLSDGQFQYANDSTPPHKSHAIFDGGKVIYSSERIGKTFNLFQESTDNG